MRVLVFVGVFLVGVVGYAQPVSYGNFKVADQEIVYQKIFFQDTITIAKLAAYYGTLPYVSGIVTSGEELKFNMNEIMVDYRKFQFTQVVTPPIIQTGKYSGEVQIGVKDGKYRVTVRSIQFTGDMGYKKIPAKENLTNYACKNSGTYLSQDWCKPTMLGLLDLSFSDKLLYVENGKKKEGGDW